MKISRFVPAAAVVIGRVAATGSDTTSAGILPRAAGAADATTDCECLVALFQPSAACGKVNLRLQAKGQDLRCKPFCPTLL
ncbi:hypothetical protein MAPG_06723 [Magnaporthiopsis poae ATCC 64411]|uniref:Uncharacterized protein n=1 Tax=Magnaporthiopsis poae (strain ATCC 64411 / 73-15) TaxID=644358 RepID=A0A0C4E2T3_MAGP6|nr:hypothetical protein MAPG_06723 [Magnaporthiopsis poae ATCC 64411]